LLYQAVQEQEQANRDIKSLEDEVRKKLKSTGLGSLDQFGNTVFIWPVTVKKGISTYFYDPTYIFRKYFEHPAIDIPTPQGTPIKAAASGYVARAKDAGLGYSYIMLVHNGGFSTVYGHVSRIDVQEDTFVNKGQIIGATGGLPGTRGAGRLTTGPHLHFEVRSNGIPVNPLDYLP
jgi:murein DD-endopeptidase MepM/ murein hydrolase activator NlpD